MNTKHRSRWLLDAALFAGLILACFVGFTGVSLHQWIGVIAGAGALYHLNEHIDWVEATGQRFFGKVAPRARTYFIIDTAMLVGFFIMVGTGLVISTWLNLSLTNYAAWRTVHITATIGTLAVTALKIVLHRNWIVQVARKWVFGPKEGINIHAPTMVARRDFLGMMGVVGAATVIAMTQSVKGLEDAARESETLAVADTTTTTTNSSTVPTPRSSTTAITSNDTTTAESTNATTETSSTANSDTTAAENSDTAAEVTACTVRCGKGCSLPGRCRRYSDSNSNNLCDLGECL
jgi:hypothetical protein